MKQEFNAYSTEDRLVWKTLFERQVTNLQDKACPEYLACLSQMKGVLNAEDIPNFRKINSWFKNTTGWEIEVVPGLIDVDHFFQLLAQKKFPSSTWLRNMDQLDYLEEPDMFHDVFGHIPLLANLNYSKFVNDFGKLGVQCLHEPELLIQLQRLYWFTIEFGLIQSHSDKQLRIYGAGILSSFGEAKRSLEDTTIERLQFDVNLVLLTPFCSTEMQDKYVIIDHLGQLEQQLQTLIFQTETV